MNLKSKLLAGATAAAVLALPSAALAVQPSDATNNALPQGAVPVHLLVGTVKLQRTRVLVKVRRANPGAEYGVLGCTRLATNRAVCSFNEYRTIDDVRQVVRYNVFGKKWRVGSTTWYSWGESLTDPVEAPQG